jgi:hypothetical protein
VERIGGPGEEGIDEELEMPPDDEGDGGERARAGDPAKPGDAAGTVQLGAGTGRGGEPAQRSQRAAAHHWRPVVQMVRKE